MNESIRRAEDERAAIIMYVASNPPLYQPKPIWVDGKQYLYAPWSVAINVDPTDGALRIVSAAAERTMINQLCGNESMGYKQYGEETEKLLVCCIGIANYSLGLIILNATRKMREPFVRKIWQMGESARSIEPSLSPDCHRDIRFLYRHADELVSLSSDSVLNPVHTEKRLETVDAMRAIVLRYANDTTTT